VENKRLVNDSLLEPLQRRDHIQPLSV